MNQNEQAGFGAAPDAMASEMPAPQGAGRGGNADPQMQEIYDRFVSLAVLHIHNEKVLPSLVERMRSGEPVQAIGEIAATVGHAVVKKAEASGQQIPDAVLLHGGGEIVQALADIARKAGIADLSEEEVEQAFYIAADTFRQMRQGEGAVDQKQMQQGMSEIADLQGSGELDRLLEGVKASRSSQKE